LSTRSKKTDQHLFSIELKSKDFIKNLALQTNEAGEVLIEGFLGKLENLNLTEGLMLEINGVNGSLKMDLTEVELERLLSKGAYIRKGHDEGENEK
jgi:hypothetical protein